MQKYKIIALCLLFASCGLTKSVKKDKKESAGTEQIITTTKRIGDTVYYKIPAIRYKDTTVYTYNRQGTRLEVRYDKKGDVDLAACIASAVAEMKQENREWREREESKEKDEELDSNLDWNVVILGVFAIAAVVVFKKL